MTATIPRLCPCCRSGAAIYFDGITARGTTLHPGRRNELPSSMPIAPAREWPYAELRRQSGPDGVLGSAVAARPCWRASKCAKALAAAIEDRAVRSTVGGARARQLRRKGPGLELCCRRIADRAGDFGVPAADQPAHFRSSRSPWRQKLGKAVDKRVRSAIDARRRGAGVRVRQHSGRNAGPPALNN